MVKHSLASVSLLNVWETCVFDSRTGLTTAFCDNLPATPERLLVTMQEVPVDGPEEEHPVYSNTSRSLHLIKVFDM